MTKSSNANYTQPDCAGAPYTTQLPSQTVLLAGNTLFLSRGAGQTLVLLSARSGGESGRCVNYAAWTNAVYPLVPVVPPPDFRRPAEHQPELRGIL